MDKLNNALKVFKEFLQDQVEVDYSDYEGYVKIDVEDKRGAAKAISQIHQLKDIDLVVASIHWSPSEPNLLKLSLTKKAYEKLFLEEE